MSSAGSSILTPRPAGWPAAAVHSTAACRVQRLFSGRENPEPTQGGMTWSLGSSRRARHSASDPGTVAMDVRASPHPKQGTDEATGSPSAPAHCGHAPGSRSGLWTRAERSPDLRARQRSEGSRPGEEEAGWAGSGCGDPCIQDGAPGAPTAGLGAHQVNNIRPRFFLSDKSTIISETENFKHPNS